MAFGFWHLERLPTLGFKDELLDRTQVWAISQGSLSHRRVGTSRDAWKAWECHVWAARRGLKQLHIRPYGPFDTYSKDILGELYGFAMVLPLTPCLKQLHKVQNDLQKPLRLCLPGTKSPRVPWPLTELSLSKFRDVRRSRLCNVGALVGLKAQQKLRINLNLESLKKLRNKT